MNNYKYIFIGLIMSFVFAACHNHEHNSGDHAEHDHGANEKHPHDDGEHAAHKAIDHGDHGKMVHLNQAQYLNAEIDTGWFVMKNISEVVNANGYTKLDPQDEADVSLPVTGTINKINVIEGDYVKRGQTLATMISLEYNKMLMEGAELNEELIIAESNLVYLTQEFVREEQLYKDGISTLKAFQKVSADLRTERAKVEIFKQQIQLQNQTIALISNDGSNNLMVKAPISGHITDLNVKIGSVTMPGSPLFAIVDNSKMHVDMLVYEKDLSKVRVGQIVRFILTNQSNREIKGEVYNIGKSFASDTKSVAVHADIEKNDANLIPGMYINALIDIGANKVRALPESAIIRAEGREFVFLWEATNEGQESKEELTFVRMEVKTGARQLGYIETTPLGEIHDGDKVVLDGSYYLQSHLQKAESGGGHSH